MTRRGGGALTMMMIRHNACWGQVHDVARIGCNVTLMTYLPCKNAHGLICLVVVILVAAVAAVAAVTTAIVVFVATTVASSVFIIMIVVILFPPLLLSLLSSFNGRSRGAMNEVRLCSVTTKDDVGGG